jgi:Putative prokaryotic signal transducing protein
MAILPDDRSAMEDRESAEPLFCPGCRKSYARYRKLTTCPVCGLTLLQKGYCGVCGSFWALSPGELCPKHDLVLTPQPQPDDDRAGEGKTNWVVVATYTVDTEAEAKRLRLESEGIPTRLDNERMGSGSMLQVATGGIDIMVPEDKLAEARVILSQQWKLTSDQDHDESEDEWEGLEPEHGSDWRRRIMKSVIWLLLFPTIAAFVVFILLLGVVWLIQGLLRLLGG